MQVCVPNGRSSPREVSSGVPQGSVLGPVLFLIYVNHVVADLKCNYKLFADDIKLYLCGVSNRQVYEQVVQRDIDILVSTSESWGLTMNIEKVVCIRFGGDCPTDGHSPYNIKGNCISFVKSHGDLGVKIEKNMKFHSHTRQTAGLCSGLTTNIFTSTLCRDSEFLMRIYLSHIRPKLEYASTLWNQGYDMDIRLLERVQKRWTREVSGLSGLTYPERLRRLDLFSVQGRLLRADMIMTWKIFNQKCAIKSEELFTMNVTSRRGHSLKIFHPRVRTNLRMRSFAVRIIPTWNALAADTVETLSLNTFKHLLKRDLGDRLYACFDD